MQQSKKHYKNGKCVDNTRYDPIYYVSHNLVTHLYSTLSRDHTEHRS